MAIELADQRWHCEKDSSEKNVSKMKTSHSKMSSLFSSTT